MHDFLVSTVAFIVLIGVMVIVHEFGHFIVAKLCGVRVEAFSVGFGPRLFGVKYGETDYKVCLLPLGGFVKMTGETPDQISGAADQELAQNLASDPGAFTSHPRWQRMLIGLAGPVANFILAFVLMLAYYAWFNEVPSVQVKTTTVDWITPDSAAAKAGIQPGDVIQRFDTVDNPGWEQVYERAKLNANQNVAVVVDRAGHPVDLTLHIPASAKNDDFDVSDAGLLPQYRPGPINVQDVQPDSPAAKAGLQPGDAIASVDGHALHSIYSLISYLQAGQGKPVTLGVLRHGAPLTLVATPVRQDNAYKIGFSAAPIPYRRNPLGLAEASAKSTTFCAQNSFLIVEVLQRIFEHKVAVSQLSGPVGIAVMAGQAAETKSWLAKFGLASEISLNLGILNLLPFPILDGGLILLLMIESVLRHDINVVVKERIYQAAFVLIVVFFAFVIFNDVSKLQLFNHLKL